MPAKEGPVFCHILRSWEPIQTVSTIMAKKVGIKWFKEPEDHYPAALSCLSLIYEEKQAADYVNRLKKAVISEFKLKDIFRAPSLSLLGISNTYAKTNQEKSKPGKRCHPFCWCEIPSMIM